MPTQTYRNLPPEKQERIFQAALEEFSHHSFSQASINRIVKAADIPRGSFYQYFADKEDCYLLVMERIGEEKLEIFSFYRSRPDRPFFESIQEALPAIFDWEERCPAYSRIALLMQHDGSDFIRAIIERLGTQKKLLRDILERDMENGYLRPDADLDATVELYMMMSMELVRIYYSTPGGREECVRRVAAMLDILGRGVFTEEAEKQWQKKNAKR